MVQAVVGLLKGAGALLVRHKYLSIGLSLLTLGFVTVGEVRRELVVLHPFDVPQELSTRGLTGALVARRLADHMEAVRTTARTQAPLREVCDAEAAEPPELEVVGADLDLPELVAALRRFTGRTPARVTGDVIAEPINLDEAKGRRLTISVRVNGRLAYRDARAVRDDGLAHALEELLAESALAAYDLAEPYVGALYRLRKDPPDIDGARVVALRCLTDPPEGDEPWAASLLGLLATEANPTQAIEWFEEAHRYADDGVFPPALLARGVLHYEQGELNEAERLLREAMEYPLTAAKAEHALARTLTKQGRIEEALRTYAVASRRQDALPQVLIDWGSLLLDLNRPEEACRRLGRAVELDPGSLETAVLFARAQQECAGSIEAQRALDRAELLRNSIARASSLGLEKPAEVDSGTPADFRSWLIARSMVGLPLARDPLALAAVDPEELVGWDPVLHEDIEGLFDPGMEMADVIERIEIGEGSVAAEADAAGPAPPE